MRCNKKFGGAGGVLIVGAIAVLYWASTAQAFEMRWGAGSAGGLWNTIAAAMVEDIKQKNPGITGTSLPGPGGQNFLGIQSGRFNLAFATNDASAFAWEGKEAFAGKPIRSFRNVASFFPHVFQYLVWADSGIKTIPDLKGKRVTYTVRGSGSELNVRKVLELYGVLNDVKFEYISFSDAQNQMKDRLIDAILLNTLMPLPVFMDLANTRPIRFLPMSEEVRQKMLAWNGCLEPYTLPAGLYKGVDQPVPGYAFRMHLIAAENVPEDVVYKIAKTLVENLQHYATVAKPMAIVTVKDMARKWPIPFHPGAARYYKEIGLYGDEKGK